MELKSPTLYAHLQLAPRHIARLESHDVNGAWPLGILSKDLHCLPSPSIWALWRSIHATTSFDATIAVPGEIYSRGMNSLPHRN